MEGIGGPSGPYRVRPVETGPRSIGRVEPSSVYTPTRLSGLHSPVTGIPSRPTVSDPPEIDSLAQLSSRERVLRIDTPAQLSSGERVLQLGREQAGSSARLASSERVPQLANQQVLQLASPTRAVSSERVLQLANEQVLQFASPARVVSSERVLRLASEQFMEVGRSRTSVSSRGRGQQESAMSGLPLRGVVESGSGKPGDDKIVKPAAEFSIFVCASPRVQEQ